VSSLRFRAFLAIGAALHALAWTVIIPPAQGPDEEEHFAYVQYLVEERRIPSYGSGFYLSEEWDTALRASGFDRLRWQTQEKFISFIWPPADSSAASRPSSRVTVSGAPAQSPLYYSLAAIPYLALRDHSIVMRHYGSRALGMLIAALTALMAYATLRAWMGWQDESATETIARLGAVLTAAYPQAAFMAGVVNVDATATLFWTCALWAAAPPPGGEKYGRLFAAGFFCGIAYLSKSFGFSAFLVVGLLLFLRAFFSRRHQVWKKLMGTFVIGASLPVLPWVAWILHRPGGAVGLGSSSPIGTETFLDIFYVTTPWTLFSQAWGVFGWLDAPLPKGVRFVIALPLILP